MVVKCVRARLKEDDEFGEHLECNGRVDPTALLISYLYTFVS